MGSPDGTVKSEDRRKSYQIVLTAVILPSLKLNSEYLAGGLGVIFILSETQVMNI